MSTHTVFSSLLVLKFVLGSQPCYEGYFSEKNGQCMKCPEHCLFCDSDKYCLSCANGYWGTLCERPCLKCKDGTSCEKTNGFCLEKCKDGYTGLLCDGFCSVKCLTCDRMNASLCEMCSNNLQGKSCEKPCPQFCMNSSCNETGYCTSGCENGYWGPMCNNFCRCKGKSCDGENGTCVNTGIDKGNEQSWNTDTGILAIVIVVFVGSFMFVAVIISPVFYRYQIARYCEKRGENYPDREIKSFLENTTEDPGKEQSTCSAAEEAETKSFLENTTEDPEKEQPTCSAEIKSFLEKTTEDPGKVQPTSSAAEGAEALNPDGQKGSLEFRNVSSFSGDTSYLVCHDPAVEQGDEFWEMVWQKNCNVFVNLTSSVEETEEEGYFPKQKETQTYGSIRVTNTDVNGYEEKQYELEKLKETKHIYKMQFSHWPRDGFPENLPKLIEFRQRTEEVRTRLAGPLLIHCSGEQSRSDTYIALDNVLNELERGNNSDITVEQNLKRLRAEGLVASNEQFSFLQNAVDIWREQKAVDIWRAPRSTKKGKIVEPKYPQIKGHDDSNQEKCLSCLIDSHKAFPEHRHVFGFSGVMEYIICKVTRCTSYSTVPRTRTWNIQKGQ